MAPVLPHEKVFNILTPIWIKFINNKQQNKVQISLTFLCYVNKWMLYGNIYVQLDFDFFIVSEWERESTSEWKTGWISQWVSNSVSMINCEGKEFWISECRSVWVFDRSFTTHKISHMIPIFRSLHTLQADVICPQYIKALRRYMNNNLFSYSPAIASFTCKQLSICIDCC
jgi:hypothetical protein